MSQPFFSIVMPTYRTEEWCLKRAIECVRQQTFGSWELLIVDDNASDSELVKTKRIITDSRLDPTKVRLIVQQVNQGAGAARNRALNECSGEWIAFLDADDFWDSRYLETTAGVTKKDNPAIVSSNITIVNDRGSRVMGSREGCELIRDEEYVTDHLSCPSGICVRRDLLNKAGGFDSSLPAREDWDMWTRVLRCAERPAVTFLKKDQVFVYRSEGRDSVSSSARRNVEGTQAVLHKIEGYEDVSQAVKARCRRAQLRYCCLVCIKEGEGQYLRRWLHDEGQIARSLHFYVLSYAAPLVPRIRRLVKKRLYALSKNQGESCSRETGVIEK